MIFRTQKIEELKNIEYQSTNPQITALKQKVLHEVWPQTNHHNFCQVIESIALKWLNQFVNLIEQWLTQSSSKYIAQLSLSNQIQKSTHKDKAYQYILNLSKFIQSMQHPLITSINNINSLYLKFPSDQFIYEPKKTFLNQSVSFQQTSLKKKKSLSIQSFTSHLPTRSRSHSKNRKLSFFKNTTKPHLFQNFCKDKKNSDTLNTTIKKVKKELHFSKTVTASTFHSHPNQNNQKQSQGVEATDLKHKLEKRLSNTCSSTFFNQIVGEQSLSREESFVNGQLQTIADQKSQGQLKSTFEKKKERKELEQDLRKSILNELDRKEKSNYEHLLNDIENKLSNKFDALLNGILKGTKTTEKQERKEDQKENIQNSIKKTESQECIVHQTFREIKHQQNYAKTDAMEPGMNKSQKLISNQIQETMGRQPSICNMLKYNNENDAVVYEAFAIQEVRVVQTKKESKMNSSVIVQKDSSKIIKSRSRNSSMVKETKQIPIPQQIIQPSNAKANNKIKFSNPLDSRECIDQIQIVDSSSNAAVHQKSSIMAHCQSTKQPTTQTKQAQHNPKQQDNFYMKRIKQLKNKMQNSIKNFKNACDKLILPVNQTFMLIFSTSYQEFCSANSLPLNSQQVNQLLSKYKSKDQIANQKPPNDQKFFMDSLIKIEKMINLKCQPQKKIKIHQYTSQCIECIQNVFFQKPNLKLDSETQFTKKLQQIKSTLSNSINQ